MDPSWLQEHPEWPPKTSTGAQERACRAVKESLTSIMTLQACRGSVDKKVLVGIYPEYAHKMAPRWLPEHPEWPPKNPTGAQYRVRRPVKQGLDSIMTGQACRGSVDKKFLVGTYSENHTKLETSWLQEHPEGHQTTPQGCLTEF